MKYIIYVKLASPPKLPKKKKKLYSYQTPDTVEDKIHTFM